MDSDIKNSNNQAFSDEDTGSSVDIKMWIILIFKRWYLFVISLAIFMSIAYLQNRSWQPIYKSTAQVIIEDSKGYMGSQALLMQGFGAEKAYRNVNNQIIMFGSRDIITKAVQLDSEFLVDYYTAGRFRTTNLYKRSPIKITSTFVQPMAYHREFIFKDLGNNTYEIKAEETDYLPEFYAKGEYGKSLEVSQFFLLIEKSDSYYQNFEMFFKLTSLENVVARYEAGLAFDFIMTGSSVVSVSTTGDVAERDCDFLNLLCTEFINDNLNRKNDAATKTIEFINEQLMSITDSLKTSEDKLMSYKKDNFIVANAGSSSIIGKYTALEGEATQMRLQESYLSYLTNYLSSNVDGDSIVAPSSLGISDASLTAKVSEFSELQLMRKEVGKMSPLYAKYTREMQVAKDHLLELLNSMRVTMDIQKKDLEDRMALVESEIQELPYKEQQFLNIQRKFEINDNYYSFLIEKRTDAQIQKASNSADNIILDKARTMSVINSSQKGKTYSTFMIIGLLIPLGLVVAYELLKATVSTELEIEGLTKKTYPIFTMIRKMKHKKALIVTRYPKSSSAEAFRVLRTRLGILVNNSKKMTIAVTSSQSGDGKTFISVNMAGIYAMTKQKTLLIDMDIRKSSVLKTLDLPEVKRGLTNYFIEDVNIEDLILKPRETKFDILPVGVLPPNPAEILASDKMKNLIGHLQSIYDYIIIDTSPVGLVADAYPLFAMVDYSIFTVACNKTSKALLKNTVQQLKAHGVNNLGIIFNNVDTSKMEYAVYYSNYAGYGKYYNSYRYTKEYTKGYFDDIELNNEEQEQTKNI